MQKKLVYHYLSYYAKEKSDLALLMVNTLAKDFGDGNPMARGLALRTMTSLQIPYLLEHILPRLKQGLMDVNAYVRKTAALGCAKLLPIASEQIVTPPILERLHILIDDLDPQVSSNALSALEEMLKDQGGVQMTETRVLSLLQRFGSYNAWSRAQVLSLVLKYSPSSQEEVLAVLNLLDGALRTSSVTVVLSIANLFLKYTSRFPDIHRAVYSRLKDPLVSLTTAANNETTYVALSHLLVLVQRQPEVFADLQRRFYLKQSDPTYLKSVKIELLLAISKNSSILQLQELITELAEYAKDKSPKIAHLAVHALTRTIYRGTASSELDPTETIKKSPVATKIAEQVVAELLQLLEIHWTCTYDAALAGLTTVLRLHPNFAGEVLPKVIQAHKLNEGHPMLNAASSAIAEEAYVWILGEYGAEQLETPYLLEAMVDNWSATASRVKLQLLSSVVRVFFVRPPEMKPGLLALLDLATEDAANPAVLDKALLITRLLATDAELAQRVFLGRSRPVASFVADLDTATQDMIFDEFNTLSVLYREPSTAFIQEYDLLEVEDPYANLPAPAPQSYPSASSSTHTSTHTSTTGSYPPSPSVSSQSLVPSSISRDASFHAPQANTPPPSNKNILRIGQLKSTGSLQPKIFETMWKALPVAHDEKSAFAPRSQVPKDIENVLRDFKIFTVASGIKSGAITLFSYAQMDDAQGLFVLLNMRIDITESKIHATIKCEDAAVAEAFVPFFQRVLQEVE